ncbi:universal stress protein UspA-like protein [Desulfosporosinus orientis DSM 765]|uniref:Universal stress protein n=1 Tax=Desulfosporosinus orientis (strain ATCC 19365 / DSM 765 / NCIMB 8382 / VKM B-1628 / Singapore I) TaxID=768706 RepID=G7W728_DESOD|nr:universal stress protein [Desulfosporosinus orientis]AET69885.1 universal stress protein UspA-like protein [Desulfosporosinus orientis DSM 765]
MFKRILVPTDVSEASRKALITALQLARQFNSEVELFHVTYNPEAYWGYTVSYDIVVPQEQIDQIGEAALEAALTGIDVPDIRIQKKHISGHPAAAIIEEAKGDFDLVVMGSHGHGPITGAVLGSVTQRVLAHIQCPVLVVK